MYEVKVKYGDRERVEVYGRLCEVTDRMAVLFFQKGTGVTLEIKQIRGELYEGMLNENKF